MNDMPENPTVIVVGAGAAGLSAAKTLRQAGIKTLVLEAADHTGGRCVTDHATFSAPFDRGGSWLHSGPINPLAPIAEQRGTPLHKAPAQWWKVQTEGYDLTSQEMADYQAYQDKLWETVSARGARQPDVTVADAMPATPWAAPIRCSISHMLGGDADVTSAEDSFNYAEEEGDWLVGGGLGGLIQDMHADVPVHLNCPVRKIDYSGKGVRVSTPEGTVQADHLILTVSTGVLAADTIEFVPPLPDAKRAAIEMLPNGLLNKVGIEFDPKWRGAAEAQIVDYHSGGEEFCSTQFGFFDTPLAVAFTGGRFAAELEKEGPGAATDFCLQGLRAHFGSDVTKSILRTDETAWQGNPFTYGAYSYAKPGGAGARETLAQTIANRIFFAGEATMRDTYSTVHGAYLSGLEAAERIKVTMGVTRAARAI